MTIEHPLPQIKIAIIGGGWYGCHAAGSLRSENSGFFITIFEKCTDIFAGVSGTFGNRLHVGTHYPRSPLTRKFCHRGYKEFYAKYPELINEHSHSFYGLGIIDADGNPSKVNKEEFAAVCREFGDAKELPIDSFSDLQYIVDIREPSLTMGVRLRNFFKEKLSKLGVELRCNVTILNIKKSVEHKFILETSQEEYLKFDYVINATGFQALLPKEILDFKIFYQACFALVYNHKNSPAQPFSFIVMDGKFPSLMPYDDRLDKNIPISKYVLTHASITLSKLYENLEDAKNIYRKMDVSIRDIKSKCEYEITRFYPKFKEEFTYIYYMGVILAKVKTLEDFRGAITFKTDGIIYFIPGKISNVFQVSREALSFINSENILNEKNYSYIKDGIFDQAKKATFKQSTSTDILFFKKKSSNDAISYEAKNNSLSIKC